VNANLRKELMAYYEIDNRVLGAQDWETGSRMGVVLEHLLKITQQAVGAGKQLLISDITFRAASGRITIKLVANSQKTAEGFTRRLNDLEIDGKKPYVAQLGPWQQTKTIDDMFTGRADMSVEIVELAAFVAGQKKRDKEREKRIKNLKRGIG